MAKVKPWWEVLDQPWLRALDIREADLPPEKTKVLRVYVGSPKYFKANMFRIEILKRGKLLADFEFCQDTMSTLLNAIGYKMVKTEWKQKVDEAIKLVKEILRLEQALKIFEELAEIEATYGS